MTNSLLRSLSADSNLTPEHEKRPPSSHLYHEVEASYRYVESVLWTADVTSQPRGQYYAWHRWALREAFLAGCTHARSAVPHADIPPAITRLLALCAELVEASDRFDALAEKARAELAEQERQP